ncbi:InlB B-repeat-containing protein [Collinsella sp. LCP19S3_D5]|uniref:InlB B-repeat-containing protein n=1 Tax=Collinsella sp. LCP19S3_D5 TaxID=3438764 RepID=UPI003F8DF597
MRRITCNRALAGLLAVVMAVGQIPTPALAEAAQSPDQAISEQGGGSEVATGSDTGEAVPAEDESAAEDAAATNAEQQQGDRVATYAARASRSIRKAGSKWSDVSKSDVYWAVGMGGTYRIRLNGTDKWTEIKSWDWGLDSGSANLEPGVYEVQERRLFNWVDDGDLTLTRFWTATVVTEGAADATGAQLGGIVVDGQLYANHYDIDEGTPKTFTVQNVDDYKVDKVQINGETKTPDAYGNYTIPNTVDSQIKVTYKADTEATVKVDDASSANLESLTVGGTSAVAGSSVSVNVKNSVSVVAKPAPGYAVKSIEFDGITYCNGDASLRFKNQVATLTLPELTKDETYKLKVNTVKAGLVGIDGAEVGILGKDSSTYNEIVFNAALDAAKSVPAGLTADDVTIEYNASPVSVVYEWKSLDYTPAWPEVTLHAFGKNGKKDSEQIRISYAGNDQYPASSITLTVKPVDGRTVTHISMNAATSVQYSEDFDALKAKVYRQLAPTVVDEVTGKPVNGLSRKDFEIDGLEQKVGEYTVTMKFKGNGTYKPSEATATVTVTKAPSSVKVKNTSITYGNTVAVADLVSSTPSNKETEPVIVVAGIDGDGKGYLSIDLSYVGGGKAQSAINSILHLDKGVTLDGLINLLNNDAAMTALRLALKAAGVENPDQVIDSLKSALDTAQDLGLGGSTVALGGTPSKAGVYLVTAVTTSGNYETSAGVGYLTIAPKTEDVTLTWNASTPKGGFAVGSDELANFDFGAKVVDSDAAVAGAKVRYLITGIAYDGSTFKSTDPNVKPTKPGCYTEVAYVLGGNYAAAPITRAFKISRLETTISMGDEIHEYDGAAQAMNAQVYVGDQPLEGAEVTFSYFGMSASGAFDVKLNGMPTEAGTYKVVATYLGDAQHATSSKATTLKINPREVSVKANNASKIYGEADPESAYSYELIDRGTTPWKGGDLATEVSPTVSYQRQPGEDPGVYTLHINAATCNRNFKLNEAESGVFNIYGALTVKVDGHGTAGLVEDAPAGGEPGTPIGVNAVADEGYVFTGWTVDEGDAKVEDANATETIVRMGSSNTTLTAHFELAMTPIQPMTYVTVEAGEGGSATSNPRGALPGTKVALTAVADEGYVFDHWEVIDGDIELADAASATTTFLLGEKAVTVRALFKAAPAPEPVPDPKDPSDGKGSGSATTVTETRSAAKKQDAAVLPHAGDRTLALVAGIAIAGVIVLAAGFALTRRHNRR